MDGDGVPELITAPGPDPSAGADQGFQDQHNERDGAVEGWCPVGGFRRSLMGVRRVAERKRKETGIKKDQDGYGANMAAGDLDGDGKAEIIFGAGPDPEKNGRVVILYNSDGDLLR